MALSENTTTSLLSETHYFQWLALRRAKCLTQIALCLKGPLDSKSYITYAIHFIGSIIRYYFINNREIIIILNLSAK